MYQRGSGPIDNHVPYLVSSRRRGPESLGVFATGGAFTNQYRSDVVRKSRIVNNIRKKEILASKTRPVVGEWITDDETTLNIAVANGDINEVAWILQHEDIRGCDLDNALRMAVCGPGSVYWSTYWPTRGREVQWVKIPIIKMLLKNGADIMAGVYVPHFVVCVDPKP
jgi:hypothetical protein